MKKTIITIILWNILLLGFTQTVSAENVKNNEDADLSFLPPSDEDDQSTNTDISKANDNNANKKQINEELLENKSNTQFVLDNVFQAVSRKNQNDLVFNVSGADKENSDWSNLTRLGLRSDTELQNNLSFKTNLLLNIYTRNNDSFNSSKDIRFDIKEAYLSWQQSPTQFFDIGRINIKSGIASGFNPTDYFKVGSLIDRNTEDVSQLRDARIGALVFQGQKLWEGGSLSVVVSPKITNKDNNWSTNKNIYGLNLQKSNDRSRVMLKLNQKITEDFAPEIIYYNESGKHNLGLNISRAFNNQWLGYAEWNIGERRKLVDEAFESLSNNQRLHPLISQKFTKDQSDSYQQQFAVGFSYTSSLNITTNVEYHYNQASLSKAQSKKWFDIAETSNNSAVLGQLLSIRGLARTRNEPLGQHSLFLRSKWNDAITENLDLTGLLISDLNDNSHLLQLEAEYELNPKSSLSLKLAKFQGDPKSNYGSLDNDLTTTLQFMYSF